MFRGQAEGSLVHGIARAKSEEDSFWKLVGERREGLGYDGRVSTDEVCYADSDSDTSGPGGYRGESSEGFGCGCRFCSVEQMVVYEDRVEAVFLTEMSALDDVCEGFVGCLEEPDSELDLVLHASANTGLRSAISTITFSTFI